MRYTVFRVDDSRKRYTDKIFATLADWPYVETKCVDGRVPEQLSAAEAEFPLQYLYPFRKGQVGIWYTVLNALRAIGDQPLMTIEDDAILFSNFVERAEQVWQHVPDDCDFFSLYQPREQVDWFYQSVFARQDTGDIIAHTDWFPNGHPDLYVNEYVSRTFQRSGGVSMIYTSRGASRILNLVKETGLTDQYDDYLYRYARLGKLNGYTVNPRYGELLHITGDELSIVQETERISN